MSERLEAFTLFSSSKGNSALFRYQNECILIDAGVSARALDASLHMLGASLREVKAVFVTHEHSDHIKGLEMIARHFRIPIYAPYLCCRFIRAKYPSTAGLLRVLDGPVEASPFLLRPFPTPHDAEDSVCYRVEAGNAAVGYATDIGHLTADIGRCVLGCDAVVLESNHDIDMLKNGGYPLPLKKRILGEYGHLSNRTCATALPRLVESGVRRVVLAHLSPENNRPALAYSESRGALAAKSISVAGESVSADVSLAVASPCEPVRIL